VVLIIVLIARFSRSLRRQHVVLVGSPVSVDGVARVECPVYILPEGGFGGFKPPIEKCQKMSEDKIVENTQS